MMNATRAALAVAATVALFPSIAGAGRPGPNPPSPTYPPARYWHNITGNGSPDAATSRVYMFGGNGGLPGTAYLNDLWYYRAGTGLWTLLTPTGRSWPQLGRGNGTISCGAGKCVMFGGTLGTKYVNETWYFTEPTGSTTTVGWSQVACKTPGSCPSARYLQLMAFDPTRHYHVMIGGYNDNALTLGDTWTFDGARWTLRAASSAAPVRSAGSATFVPSHMSNGKSIAIDKVVIFGGDPYPNDPYPAALCDLWAWNGTTWEAIQAPGPKPCLVGATMAWDTSASSGPRLVVAGGFPAPGTNTPNTDTWYFTFATSNSGTWTKASPSVCAPLAFARGAYAASSKKLVFFGGGDGTGNAFGDTLVCP
jgi:hypothetical protein